MWVCVWGGGGERDKERDVGSKIHIYHHTKWTEEFMILGRGDKEKERVVGSKIHIYHHTKWTDEFMIIFFWGGRG